MMPYSQNVPEVSIALLSMGKVKVIRKLAIHKAVVVMDIAAPRILFGKISETNTQNMGARLSA